MQTFVSQNNLEKIKQHWRHFTTLYKALPYKTLQKLGQFGSVARIDTQDKEAVHLRARSNSYVQLMFNQGTKAFQYRKNKFYKTTRVGH